MVVFNDVVSVVISGANCWENQKELKSVSLNGGAACWSKLLDLLLSLRSFWFCWSVLPLSLVSSVVLKTSVVLHLNKSHCTKKFSIKDVFSKCDEIRSFLRIWSHLLKNSIIKNLIFCAVSHPLKMFYLWLYFTFWYINMFWSDLWRCLLKFPSYISSGCPGNEIKYWIDGWGFLAIAFQMISNIFGLKYEILILAFKSERVIVMGNFLIPHLCPFLTMYSLSK